MERTRQRLIVIVAAVTVIAVAGVWYVQPKPSTPTRTGLVVPAAFHTTNGPYSATYDFITPSLGWALLVDYHSSTTFFVFKTTDGASHWRKQYTGDAGGYVARLQFFDARNGFLDAGLAYRTVDGGDHWQQIDVPGSHPTLTFASPTRGWAEVFGTQPLPSLYRTVDGGRTWTQAGAVPPSSEELQPWVEGASSRFRESGEGWLGAIHQPVPTVFLTGDGGATWRATQLFPTFGTGYYYDVMVRLIAGRAVVAFVSEGGLLLGAFLSMDGASSWAGLYFPFVDMSPEELTFMDADHWWLFHSGSVYTTDDGGGSWTYLHDLAFPSSSWRSTSARGIDRLHAWWALTSTAISDVGALAMTSDGGEHWAMVNAPQP